MDKNELSLEEIIAANNAIRADVEGDAAEASSADSEKTLDEIISDDADTAAGETEVAAEEADITADDDGFHHRHAGS